MEWSGSVWAGGLATGGSSSRGSTSRTSSLPSDGSSSTTGSPASSISRPRTRSHKRSSCEFCDGRWACHLDCRAQRGWSRSPHSFTAPSPSSYSRVAVSFRPACSIAVLRSVFQTGRSPRLTSLVGAVKTIRGLLPHEVAQASLARTRAGVGRPVLGAFVGLHHPRLLGGAADRPDQHDRGAVRRRTGSHARRIRGPCRSSLASLLRQVR